MDLLLLLCHLVALLDFVLNLVSLWWNTFVVHWLMAHVFCTLYIHVFITAWLGSEYILCPLVEAGSNNHHEIWHTSVTPLQLPHCQDQLQCD